MHARPATDVMLELPREIDGELARQASRFEAKVFVETRRRDQGPYQHNVNQGLAELGWLHDFGHGQVAYRGPVLRLARLVDAKAAELYAQAFGAEDGHYPALVDAGMLHKCGYFEQHPNTCSEGAPMPPDAHIHFDGLCPNPAACFPCYPTLTGQTFDTGRAFTWLGRVFRHEPRNISGLDRLCEFDVRELVFVGDEDYVRGCRRRALLVVESLATYFDIDCRIQTAADPFPGTAPAASKLRQAAHEVKSEIRIPALDAEGSVRQLACGSINLHGDFFGRRFGLGTTHAGAAQTGCVGLGIERWVLATFTQHGFEPARWPESVRRIVFP